MVFLPQHNLIVSFRFKIRRITIKKGVRSVILTDQRLEILILYDRVLQPPVCLPYGRKGLADVERLAAI